MHRALPIKMYLWVFLGFSGGSAYGTISLVAGRQAIACWAGILLDYKKGGRASANQLSSGSI